MCFIHSRLSRLHFALRRNIVNYRDIQILSFFNRGRCQFFMNVYLDDLHTAVNFLTREALNIPNLLYMDRDFNIRDAEWDPSVSFHHAAGQSLRNLAESYSLVHSLLALFVPTYYSDIVVATTRWNSTRSMLTLAKLSVGYLVVGITRELNKEPLLY